MRGAYVEKMDVTIRRVVQAYEAAEAARREEYRRGVEAVRRAAGILRGRVEAGTATAEEVALLAECEAALEEADDV